jgi:hypothetical protein
MEELGDKNPHRTLKGFFCDPFIAAFADPGGKSSHRSGGLC